MMANDDVELSFYNKPYSHGCPGCYRIDPQPPGLDFVYRDHLIRVHQDYAVPIAGMMVVEVVRHISNLTDLSPNEQIAFWSAIVKTRQALASCGITTATLMLEERSSHAHAWWFPNRSGGTKFKDIKPLMDEAAANPTPERILLVEETVQKIKTYFTQNPS